MRFEVDNGSETRMDTLAFQREVVLHGSPSNAARDQAALCGRVPRDSSMELFHIS